MFGRVNAVSSNLFSYRGLRVSSLVFYISILGTLFLVAAVALLDREGSFLVNRSLLSSLSLSILTEISPTLCIRCMEARGKSMIWSGALSSFL